MGANRDKLTDFAIYCAKALAGIGKLPDTVADRTIAVELKRKKPGESAARFRRREARKAAGPLHRTLASLLEHHLDWLAEARPELPDELDDRALDTWEVLLAIADLAGGDWPERARRAAVALSGAEAREDDSAGIVLLRDLRAVFDARGDDRLASSAICDDLHEIEESPWADWYGKPITVRGVAKLLARYGIRPKQLWVEAGNVRGYERESFEDAWARHLLNPPLIR